MNENLPATLNDLSVRINEEHRQCETAARSAVQHAINAGNLLAEAKAQCPHGTWGKWLSENFEGSHRTANAYMRVAREWPELQAANSQRSANLSIDAALKALSEPRQSKPDPQATYELHPIAEERLLPFSDNQYAGLVESIQRHGMHMPITLYEGKILDGWHRYQACRQAGAEPHFIELPEGKDPVAYWRSVNLMRGTYSRDQVAIMLAKLEELENKTADKPREQSPPDAMTESELEATTAKIHALLDNLTENVPKIRDTEGYKLVGYSTFDEFCRTEWLGLSAQEVNDIVTPGGDRPAALMRLMELVEARKGGA